MEDNLTGFASIDKPWKKYYTKEEMEMPIPRCTVYESIYENNQNHLEDIALLFFVKNISLQFNRGEIWL